MYLIPDFVKETSHRVVQLTGKVRKGINDLIALQATGGSNSIRFLIESG